MKNIILHFTITLSLIFLLGCNKSDSPVTPISNSGQWEKMNMTFPNSIPCFAVSGTTLFAGTWGNTGNGIFMSSSNGANWVSAGLTGENVMSLVSIGNVILAGTENGVFRTLNNGTNWEATNSGLSDLSVRAMAVIDTNNMLSPNFFAGTTNGVYKSTNYGSSWVAVNNGMTNSILELAVSGRNLYAGSYTKGVFKSTNSGVNWTAVNSGLTNLLIISLAASGTNVYAGTVHGAFISTNNGLSWSACNNGLTNDYVIALASSGNNLFAGTNAGVFLSTNNGANWVEKNQGFNPAPDIWGLIIANGYVYVGTIDKFIWRRLYSEIISN